MKRPLVSSAFLTVTFVISSAIIWGQSVEPAAEREAPVSSEIVVPAETLIPLTLKNAINTRTAFVGQSIYCETIYPITVGNRIVIPVGTYVKGTVTQVVRPGRVKGKAQLGVRFDSLTLPNGVTKSLRAALSSSGGTGDETVNRDEGKIVGGGSKGADARTVGISSAQGATIGGLGTRTLKGAGVGAIAGGVGGLVWILASRGKEIVLPPGYNLEFQLAGPLAFYRDEIGGVTRYDDGPALPSSTD